MEIDSDSKESLQFDKSREIVGAESITESESDDLFNDNISVISDSLTSKNLKKYDMKKISATIQRLKQENASLRDSLDKINATDVALVRQKLRGANADIQRLKQLNAELKDRNQILEERLVNLLAEHSGGISAKAKLTSMAKQKHSPPPTPADAALTNEAVNQHETQSAGTSSVYFPSSGQHHALEEESRSLQKKLKHAERLLQSYEVKLRLLQEEYKGEKVAVGDISESAAAVPSAVTFQEPLEPRKRRIYTENDMKTRLAEARDTDKRTIEALIQELNRLEAQQRGKGVETRDESVEAHLPDTQTAANRPGTISPSMDASTETKNDRWSPPNSVVVIPSLVIASAIFLYTMNQLYMHIRSSSPNPR